MLLSELFLCNIGLRHCSWLIDSAEGSIELGGAKDNDHGEFFWGRFDHWDLRLLAMWERGHGSFSPFDLPYSKSVGAIALRQTSSQLNYLPEANAHTPCIVAAL